MSNASNLSTLANVLDDGASGQFLKSTGSGGVAFDTVAAGAVVYATADLLPLSGNSAGDMAYVTATNRFYINNGSGWYSVSLVNTNPNITSVQDASSNTTPFTLATDGTATVVTVTAADPEDIPLTYGYSVTSGSLNGSTVAQGTGSNSNVFTVTPHASQDATFTITFTASDGINQATSANAFSLSFVTAVADSNHTTLLATATGTSDNNNITDSSSNSHSITVIGDTHAGTFSPYRSGGYSTYFDGTGDYLEIPHSTNVGAFGTNDFTVQLWYYTDAANSQDYLIDFRQYGGNGDYLSIYKNGSNKIVVAEGGSNRITGTKDISVGQWFFITVHRDNGSLKLFVNGEQDGSTYSDSTNYVAGSSGNFIIGKNNGGASYLMEGYLSDIKVTHGSALDGTTVPTEPLSSSGSALHICHLPYIADGSTNDHSITINGDPETEPFSPYDYDEYSAADHGGSVFFDGGDYLTIADHNDFNLTSDFTIKFWARLNVPYAYSGNVTYGLFDNFSYNNGGLRVCINGSGLQNGKLVLYWNSAWDTVTAEQFNFIPEKNQWYYFELTRSSNTLTVKVNGESVGTVNVTNLTNPTTSLTIGNNTGVGTGQSSGTSNYNNYLYGYISDFQYITGGTASESSVPIAPMSTDTNSKLHIKGTDASIIDKSQGANLKLIGNTTGSATTNFTDAKSMYFDGSGDYVEGPTISDLNIGTGDFTVECWLYETTTNTNKGVWDGRSTGSSTDGFTFTRINTDAFRVWSGGSLITSASVTIQNQWVHCALVRNNGTLSIYINGSRSGTPVSNSTNFSSSGTFIIGAGRHGSGEAATAFITGYIQDFRVSNFARYTAPDETANIPSAPLEG